MRCREVKQWMNDHPDQLNTLLPDSIASHIEDCPECAQNLIAERLLQNRIEAELKNQAVATTPLDRIREKIELRRTSLTNKKGIFAMFKDQIKTHPRLITGFGLMAVIIMAITLIPFSYTTTVGYRMCFNLDDPSSVNYLDSYRSALDALGYANTQVSFDGDCLHVASLPDRDAVREAEVAFRLIAGDNPRLTVEPIREKTSGSLYAQARQNMTKIEIDTKDKTDFEIEQLIIQKLVAAGIVDPEVKVETLPNGERRISIETNSEGSEGEERKEMIELKLHGTDDVDFGFEFQSKTIDVETEGKTPEEIEAAVRAKLAERGIHNADVKVNVTPDGKHEIQIELEKEK
ncbi:MAG: hypothetical protein GF404_12135 [candidate division Zixibacteria bacterium]|nr:hypothetical protein [candidate division Zixibacteria bacterium]